MKLPTASLRDNPTSAPPFDGIVEKRL